ncbi:MAG: DUF4332 domain-containing protein [Bacteroidales bacterium]|nr:DUF4332 domain-containing protein [Bacteroidales bacterium]
MGYYIDLTTVSLDDYKNKLRTCYLPPSRMILKEQSDERMDYLKSIGIKNVKELQTILKNKDKMAELSNQGCLTEQYLYILLRELNSLLPKPNRLSDLPGISNETVERLAQIGIKNTVKLYNRVLTAQLRKELSEETGISEEEILELAKLTDLSRIKWVGGNFARMLYDLGYDTIEKSTKADPEVLHKQINQISHERKIYKGHIGLNDIRIFVDVSKEVPQEMEF